MITMIEIRLKFWGTLVFEETHLVQTLSESKHCLLENMTLRNLKYKDAFSMP